MKLKTMHGHVMALCVLVTMAQVGVAQQLLQQSQDGVLLLKHGTTLSGFITPAGDRYVVLLGESGEARVPATDVLAVVGSMQEAYAFKRSRLDDRLSSRIELTLWCMQHGLTARAADQLLAAERIFGRQAQLEALHQRLVASAKIASSTEQTNVSESEIGKVSFEEPVDALPGNTVDVFTSSVQPLLLNRCASGGCHNNRGTSDYVLFRPFLGQATTRRLTERNLTATLAYIDRKSPVNSPLLAKATNSHGGSDFPPITEREQRQLDALQAWLHGFGTGRRSAEPTTIAPASDLLYQPGRLPKSDSARPEVSLPTARPAKQAAEPAVDPFDPAAFNERHHGRTR